MFSTCFRLINVFNRIQDETKHEALRRNLTAGGDGGAAYKKGLQSLTVCAGNGNQGPNLLMQTKGKGG